MRIMLLLMALSSCSQPTVVTERHEAVLTCRDPSLPAAPRSLDALVIWAQDEHEALLDCKAKLARAQEH